MSYFGQFKRFDPLLGDVPDRPFSLLRQIAQRARALLKTRTIEQIDSVAREIDFAIDEYFRTVKEEEIARLQNELTKPRKWKRMAPGEESDYHDALKFFEWDGGTGDNGRWLFKDAMEDQLDIPTAENTSEVGALKACIGWWDDVGIKDFPNSQPHELFAVLSLWMLADAMRWLDYRKADEMDEAMAGIWEQVGLGKYIPTYVSQAADSALKAMESVCHAEHLQIVRWWESTHKLNLAKEAARQEQERKRRSMQTEALSMARHRKTNEAKAKAIEEWEKDTSRFPSAEKAGLHLADWLATKGFEYEPRTVTTWIRVYAKQIGVRFR